MANKSKRKAFGPKKRKLYDLHHHRKKKKASSYQPPSGEAGIRHLRVDMRNV